MNTRLFRLPKIRMPRTARSLATTLAIGFFSLSVLILLVSGSLQLYSNIQSQQAAISNQEQLLAQDAAKTVSRFIDEQLTVLSTTVWLADPSTTSAEEQTKILKDLLVYQPAFRQMAIFNAENNESALATRIQAISSDASARFVSRVTNEILSQTPKGEYYISSVYFDEVSGEPVVILAVPAIDILGNYQGTLTAELNLISMWNVVNQLEVGETGYAYVVDRQGTLITFRDTNRVLNQENASIYKVVGEFMQNPVTVDAPGTSVYSGITGTQVVGTYAALGTPDWAVVIELPWDEAYRDIIRLVEESIGLILVMAVLAGFGGVYVARRLAKPLVNLTETATRIAGGEIQLQAAIAGPGEILALASAFNSMTAQLRDTLGGLEQRVAERTADVEMARLLSDRRAQDLQVISEISRLISSEQQLDVLLSLVAQLVSDRFAFYHVGIFIIDDTRQYAIFQASNSEGGKRMLARGHRLEIAEGSIVGYVAKNATARIALDVGQDAVFFNNPDLPQTRSEMSLPLISRGVTLGVLDVQSDKPGAFTENDAQNLSILADHIATSIENARLFQQVQRALRETETLYREDIKKAWAGVLDEESSLGYEQTISGGRKLTKHVESKEILEAINLGRILIKQSDGSPERYMVVPLNLRGQIIGALKVQTSDSSRQWTNEEINLTKVVSERLSLALENARLLEESQKQVIKEQTIGEVTAKIGASIDLQTVMQTAVEELGRALPGSEVILELQKKQEK